MARRARAGDHKLRAPDPQQYAMARAAHMSKRSVRELLDVAEELDLAWDDSGDMTDAELFRRLFLEKVSVGYVYPDSGRD